MLHTCVIGYRSVVQSSWLNTYLVFICCVHFMHRNVFSIIIEYVVSCVICCGFSWVAAVNMCLLMSINSICQMLTIVWSGRRTVCRLTTSALRMRSCWVASTDILWSLIRLDKRQNSFWIITKTKRSPRLGKCCSSAEVADDKSGFSPSALLFCDTMCMCGNKLECILVDENLSW